MNGKRKRITGLIVAIALVTAFLIFTIVTNERREKKERLILEKIESRKKAILESGAELPQIEDFEGEEYLTEEAEGAPEVKEEKPAQEFMLKDLPLEKPSSEKEGPEEKVLKGKALKIRPSLKEIKKLKKKGLIIY